MLSPADFDMLFGEGRVSAAARPNPQEKRRSVEARRPPGHPQDVDRRLASLAGGGRTAAGQFIQATWQAVARLPSWRSLCR